MRPRVIEGDCVDVLGTLEAGSVSLAYLDPPFSSGRRFRAYREGIRGAGFRDRDWADVWPGGIPSGLEAGLGDLIDLAFQSEGAETAGYLLHIAERLVAVRRTLAPAWTVWLHCDDSAVHWLRLAGNAVYGRRAFRNQVVWWRSRGGKSPPRSRFPRATDHLLFWSGGDAAFALPYRPLSPGGRAAYSHADPDGRIYRLDNVAHPGSGYGYRYDLGLGEKSPDNGYAFPETTARRMLEEGRLIVDPGRVPRRKGYLDESKGAKVPDIWTDITPAHRPEHLGYPTQKPLALLSRIIGACSGPDDLVLDPFCGSGTTLVAAMRMGRRAIGIDESAEACAVARDRLEREGPLWREE